MQFNELAAGGGEHDVRHEDAELVIVLRDCNESAVLASARESAVAGHPREVLLLEAHHDAHQCTRTFPALISPQTCAFARSSSAFSSSWRISSASTSALRRSRSRSSNAARSSSVRLFHDR